MADGSAGDQLRSPDEEWQAADDLSCGQGEGNVALWNPDTGKPVCRGRWRATMDPSFNINDQQVEAFQRRLDSMGDFYRRQIFFSCAERVWQQLYGQEPRPKRRRLFSSTWRVLGRPIRWLKRKRSGKARAEIVWPTITVIDSQPRKAGGNRFDIK
jgi:hypothetical protein